MAEKRLPGGRTLPGLSQSRKSETDADCESDVERDLKLPLSKGMDFDVKSAENFSEELHRGLKKYWGYDAFRPLQLEAMLALCGGRDAVIVLPTGGGKSICYQLPALVHGRVVVVSPLISLMRDQTTALKQLGIGSAFINSSITAAEAAVVREDWKSGKLNLLYVAPEKLLMPGFLTFLNGHRPRFFAVDEAHCISHWGHDFRPEYRQMRTLRGRFPEIPICALTATATKRVRADIAEQLALRDAQFFVGDFDRPNLHYRVERRRDRNTQVEEIMRAHAGKSGIIYCISRKDSESLSKALNDRGFRTAAYHAGLDTPIRNKVQHAFTNEELDAVVATVAFGMGIDRSNVRFVIHAAMPASVEHYQQETGRAGRDGLPAECVLLFSGGDPVKWRGIFDKEENTPPEQLEARYEKLREMDRFATSRRCRHRFLVEYFGQSWTKQTCGNCDCCGENTHVPVWADSTVTAQKILSCVVRLQEGYGSGYLIAVLRGESEKLQPVHCGLSTFGLLSEYPVFQIRTWIEECLAAGLLFRTEDNYPVLKVTAEGWAVLRKEATPRLSAPAISIREGASERKRERIERHKERASAEMTAQERRLFDNLRELRRTIAKVREVPAYVIFHDSVLDAIARARPTNADELAQVPGMGQAKLAAYGAQVLRVIADSA